MFPQPEGSTKKSRFTDTQIVSILKQADAGIPVNPFYISRNELGRQEADAGTTRALNWLYRIFDFSERPRLLNIPEAIGLACHLETALFIARLAV